MANLVRLRGHFFLREHSAQSRAGKVAVFHSVGFDSYRSLTGLDSFIISFYTFIHFDCILVHKQSKKGNLFTSTNTFYPSASNFSVFQSNRFIFDFKPLIFT